MTAIWWIRRDIRLSDNPTLAKAIAHGEGVVPLFIIDPFLVRNAPASRLGFLFEGLKLLDQQLKRLGSGLVVRVGKPLEVLTDIVLQVEATVIFAEEDFTPYAKNRDGIISRTLPLRLIHGQTNLHPLLVQKADGTPYTVFTPFSRTWKTLLDTSKTPLSIPKHIPSPKLPASDVYPYHPGSDLFPGGEVAGLRRLDEFSQSILHDYDDNRNRVDLEGTSSLSPYLRFGMVSLSQAAMAALNAGMDAARNGYSSHGAEAWLNELIWREFYISILYHFPNVKNQEFNPRMRNIPWRNDYVEFEAWKQGRTGFPIVDAGLRQLSATGWMHNRARMITASFLVKDLLVDWRWGERWFMSNLLDGDPAANNGGWQWTAGTGTDAAPYFRVFNPILQGQKFDPLGNYIRRWVPELAAVPGLWIHEPWKMPMELQTRLRSRIGIDYPAPIVDHNVARKRALETYQFLRKEEL